MGAPDFPRRPLADKFLYRALARVNAYKCAKFQLPSSISYGDMEGGPRINSGRCYSPIHSLAVKFLYVAIVPANACQRTKFQLASSISFGDMREVPKKWQLLVKNERTCEQRDHKNSVSDAAGAMDSFEQTVLSSAVS